MYVVLCGRVLGDDACFFLRVDSVIEWIWGDVSASQSATKYYFVTLILPRVVNYQNESETFIYRPNYSA